MPSGRSLVEEMGQFERRNREERVPGVLEAPVHCSLWGSREERRAGRSPSAGQTGEVQKTPW